MPSPASAETNISTPTASANALYARSPPKGTAPPRPPAQRGRPRASLAPSRRRRPEGAVGARHADRDRVRAGERRAPSGRGKPRGEVAVSAAARPPPARRRPSSRARRSGSSGRRRHPCVRGGSARASRRSPPGQVAERAGPVPALVAGLDEQRVRAVPPDRASGSAASRSGPARGFAFRAAPRREWSASVAASASAKPRARSRWTPGRPGTGPAAARP